MRCLNIAYDVIAWRHNVSGKRLRAKMRATLLRLSFVLKGPVSPNRNPESHQFQIWIQNPCLFEKWISEKVVWNLNPRNMNNFLTKKFSSHTLMERLKNFIDLSGNRTHSIPTQVNKIFQSFHECVRWKFFVRTFLKFSEIPNPKMSQNSYRA